MRCAKGWLVWSGWPDGVLTNLRYLPTWLDLKRESLGEMERSCAFERGLMSRHSLDAAAGAVDDCGFQLKKL